MNAKWLEIKAKFEALQLRERALLVGALIAVVYLLWDFIFLQPLGEATQVAAAKEQNAQQNIAIAQAELSVVKSLGAKDPHAQLKSELQELQEKLALLDTDLQSLSAGLVPAEQLPKILHQVLSSTSKMQLLSVVTLPVESINLEADTTAEASAPTQQARLFKHGVQVKLQGSYSHTYEFLQALESNSWQFYWEALAFEVMEHPQALVTLRIFTLASDRGTFDGELGQQ